MSKLDDIHFGGVVKNFFGLPIFNRARNSDPVTSHQAADQVTTTSKHFQIIHLALIEHGPMGKDEIAHFTDLEPNAVARRLPELQKLGLVTLTGSSVKCWQEGKTMESLLNIAALILMLSASIFVFILVGLFIFICIELIKD